MESHVPDIVFYREIEPRLRGGKKISITPWCFQLV